MVALTATLLTACARIGSGGFNGKVADLSAAGPTATDVQAVFGDSNWWAGPPTFQVRPLDSGTMPETELFGLTRTFIHVGSAEAFIVVYTAYNTVSAATTVMTNLKNQYSAGAPPQKVGDDTLYLNGNAPGAAPYVARTYVRLASIMVEIAWLNKDGPPTLQQRVKVAKKVIDGLQPVVSGKVHGKLQPVAQQQLPPPGLDITNLGSAQLAVESLPVMLSVAMPEAVLSLLQTDGLKDFAYGDYALNNDTHMEVQTAFLTFPTTADAVEWATNFSPNPPDPSGIGSGYIATGGSPAGGEYHYLFTAGTYGGLLICKPTIGGEAASRECEMPMERTALAWKLALRG
jgi:hypothetical protein